MALGVIARLKSKGVADADKHFEAIFAAFAAAIADPDNVPDSVSLDTGDPRVDGTEFRIDDATVTAMLASAESEAERIAVAMTDQFRKLKLRTVLTDEREKRLVHMDIDREAFTRRLAMTWREPFELLDLQLALAFELGATWSRKLRARGHKKDPALVEVISRLHARSLQVAAEVRALLREGFADGALSRWRTVHELAVVALFVAQEGNDMAIRYLDHLDIDSYKAALEYERTAPLLGYKKGPPKRLAALTKRATALKAKYGKPFGESFGWAASGLKGKSPDFANIEAAVKMERFRPYFRLASNTVHAGPKGAYFRLGLLGNDVLLAGPSNVGLQEAARLTALSIAQITSCLLSLRMKVDSGVWTGVLIDLSSRVEKEAVKVMRRIEREEHQVRRHSGREIS